MIEYVNTKFCITVKLDGKNVGIIVHKAEGWQYIPNGQKTGGEFFPTLGLCKKSLEAP